MAITTDDVLDIMPRTFADRSFGPRLGELLSRERIPVDRDGNIDAEVIVAPMLVAAAAILRLADQTQKPLPEVILDLRGDLLHDLA